MQMQSGESTAKERAPAPRAEPDALEQNGYVILEGLIDRAGCERIKEESLRLADKTGANRFEGHLTQRVYAPLSKTRAIDDLMDHPRILALLDALLLPNYLLSQAQI